MAQHPGARPADRLGAAAENASTADCLTGVEALAGEAVAAYVVASAPVTAADVRAWVREHLAKPIYLDDLAAGPEATQRQVWVGPRAEQFGQGGCAAPRGAQQGRTLSVMSSICFARAVATYVQNVPGSVSAASREPHDTACGQGPWCTQFAMDPRQGVRGSGLFVAATWHRCGGAAGS